MKNTAPALPAETADAPAMAAVAWAIDYLAAHYQERPALDDLAARAGYSPFHFQRLFQHYTGISPKRFAQFVMLGHAKRLLAARGNMLDTSLDLGLSGGGRLHDLFVACEAMTPGEFQQQAASLTLRWGLHATPLGTVLLAVTKRGICWLSFVEAAGEAAAIATFKAEWPQATLLRDDSATAPYAARLMALGELTPNTRLPLLLRGTNFQIKVWQALLQIPAGAMMSYGQLAAAIGQPGAARAVGHAVGQNPISWLIPCHRVIQQSGVLHNYRWGQTRKRALLAYEAAVTDQSIS